MKRWLCGLLLLSLLGGVTFHQADALRERPVELKLGPGLSPTLVQLFASEHATTLALRNVVRVMFYFGSFFEENPNLVQTAPEYVSMYRHLVQAVKIDPYNMDAYYFSQAAFTWEVGRVREVNRMLEYGMQYRTEDYLLPFYIGFNAAYFLQDYTTAARYFQAAAERSNNSLFVNLAARFLHEAGQTRLGLTYLDAMIKGAKDPRSKKIYEQRRAALLAIRSIEEAISRYRERFERSPSTIDELVDSGTLAALPVDPYGGVFFIDEEGLVRTTSKFAFTSPEQSLDKASENPMPKAQNHD